MHAQWTEKLRDGTAVLIRPIRPEDAERERIFIEGLSPEARYFRFLEGMRSPTPALIKKLTDIDQQRDAAFVALIGNGPSQRQIGVARYSRDDKRDSCECAVSVSDEFQRKGLGTLLMRHLLETARARGIQRIYSLDAADNMSMRDFTTRMGFKHHTNPDDATLVVHELNL